MLLLDISSWWQSMPGFEKVFWVFALLFSLLFVIQTIFSFVAGDGDDVMGDADASIGEDEGIGAGYFTIKNFIAFFTIFGWTGIALIKGNVNKGLTVTIAVAAGAAVVFLMILLFKSMSRLKESGNMELDNALQKIGETYLFIPASRSGAGKVHIRVQGSLRELTAMTDDAADIPTGKLVRVTEIINGNILLVTTHLS